MTDEHRARPALDADTYRDVLGRFATGVVLVTATGEHDRAGMIVNSFTSVSLHPPLVAFCAAHTSTSWPVIQAAGGFAVSILGEAHEATSRAFTERRPDRFSAERWHAAPSGHPVLSGSLAWLDCRITATHPAGDHDIVLATPTTGAAGPGRPLIFHTGRYHRLAHPRPVTCAGSRGNAHHEH